jgi:hypothetical protein
MFNNKNEFYLQNEIQSTSKSENTIILGISHRDDEIKAIVNVILTTTKWIIWKERKMLQNTKIGFTWPGTMAQVNNLLVYYNMDALFSFDLFMVYIPECKQQLRTMK